MPSAQGLLNAGFFNKWKKTLLPSLKEHALYLELTDIPSCDLHHASPRKEIFLSSFCKEETEVLKGCLLKVRELESGGARNSPPSVRLWNPGCSFGLEAFHCRCLTTLRAKDCPNDSLLISVVDSL